MDRGLDGTRFGSRCLWTARETKEVGVPNGFRRECVWPLSVVGYADLLAA